MPKRTNDLPALSSAAQKWLVASLVVFSVTVGWATIRTRESSPPERSITNRPIQVPTDGYASSQGCKACHPAQYATWRGSYHPSMTQVATPRTVRADFDAVQISAEHGGPMVLERRGSEFWAEFDDPDWDPKGAQSRRIKRQVVMITGSHHQQVYRYPTGRDRLLGQLPGMYLIAEQRWIPRNSAFMRPPTQGTASETGRWNITCINCHATHGKGELDASLDRPPRAWQVANTTAAEFGIACEACHGPSEQHQAVNRNPARRYELHLTDQPDPTTVYPLGLKPKLSSQVCGQCHSVWWNFFENPEDRARMLKDGLPYRPGDELSATRFVVQPIRHMDSPQMKRIRADDPQFVEDHFWSDGMVRMSGREYNGLIDSPCFKDATDDKRTMSCFSCHTMHKTSDDPRSIANWADTHQVSPGMDGNEACLQCHSPMRETLTAHTKHQAGSTGSSCYNCHMPYTSYGLLKALRSHQVSSPTVIASLQTGRPNACNLCHLDKTLKWTSDYLESWYDTPKPPLSADEQTVAASLLWLLRGDAGQRALVAWSMGWQPAQQAAGTSWMPPYLGLMLDDPYDAVRFIANRSLRSLPGFAGFTSDFVAPRQQRIADMTRAVAAWRLAGAVGGRTDPALLLDNGVLTDDGRRLLAQRDDRRVKLNE